MAENQRKPVIRLSPDGSISQRYDSIADAARDNGGIGLSTLITRACKTGIKHYGFHFKYDDGQTIDFPHVKKLPNVLLLDIETAPMEGLMWTLFKPRLSYDNILKDWYMLSWSAKNLFAPEVHSDVVTPEESVNQDDGRIMHSLWDLVDAADVVIGHNAKKFDIRRYNTRFFINKLKRPSSYQVIDTLEQARKVFAFSSNRLDYLGKLIARKQKLETDFDLWKRCKFGDAEALLYMEKYNREDVLLLEDVYVEMRGWISSHPNLSLYAEVDEPVCPTCLSDNLEDCGEYVTAASRFESLRCKNCGCISRMRKSHVTPKERDKLRISTAR